MVASLEVPQNSASARFNGSKNLIAGLAFAANAWRSALVSETEVATRPTGAGANAAADPKIADRRASFIMVQVFRFWFCVADRREFEC